MIQFCYVLGHGFGTFKALNTFQLFPIPIFHMLIFPIQRTPPPFPKYGKETLDLVGNPEDRFSHVERNLLFAYVKTKVQIRCDQNFCFGYINSTIPLLPEYMYENSSLKSSSVVVKAGLCRTWSETARKVFS